MGNITTAMAIVGAISVAWGFYRGNTKMVVFGMVLAAIFFFVDVDMRGDIQWNNG